MKEKIKKFMNNTVVRVIGLVTLVGAAAYVGSHKGCTDSLENQHVMVKMDGWEFVKIEDKIEDSVEEA